MEATTEVQELSLEKVIETKLIQANVTHQVLAALKEKYGGMKLRGLEDKESYLELKAAAKDCAKVRTLTVKLCKEGRERAVKEQKLWIAKEKEIVAEVDVVESALDAEIAKYENEIKRKEQEELKRKEEVYINRQASLIKMGAKYENGCFILGDASFEAELVKGMDNDIWDNDVLPKFQSEYEKIEAVRIAEEKDRAEKEAAFKAEQEKMRQEQEALRLQQENFKKEQEEAAQKERERLQAEQLEKERKQNELQRARFSAMFQYQNVGEPVDMNNLWALSETDFVEVLTNKKAAFEIYKKQQEKEAEEKRIAEIEFQKQEAIRLERERIAEEQRQVEIKKKQEEERKIAEMEAASDKNKWEEFLRQLSLVSTFQMKSSQYKKKMQMANEKIEEILSL